MRYTWLFFDADDTLFDYSKAEEQALAATLAEFALPGLPAVLPAYQQINQAIWKEFEQGAISALELRLARFVRLFDRLQYQTDPERFSQRYLVALSQASVLIAGAKGLLEALSRNYQIGLVTNGLPEVQRPRLHSAGIAPYFRFEAISEELGVSKPDPRFFAAALALAGRPQPAQVLVVGDNLTSDIRGGCQAGLDTLWYNPAHKSADSRWPATYEVDSLEGILKLLAA